MSRRRELIFGATVAAALVLLNALVVASALGFLHKPRRVLETDHLRYIAMAEAAPGAAAEAQAREQPFCYRVLAPGLVYALGRAGSGLHLAFWLTTQVFLTLFLLTLFVNLRAREFDPLLATGGMLLAALVPGAVRWYAYQYWMPDPLCLFLVTLGLHLAATGRSTALVWVSVAGVLTRETYWIVPVYASALWLRRDGAGTALRRTLAVFALPLAAFVALRLAIVPAGGPGLLDAAGEMLRFRVRHLFDNQLYFATFGTFGVLVPLLAARVRRWPSWVRARYEDVAVVAVAYASLAFANNTDRLLVYALPVLVPAGLKQVEALASATRLSPAAILAVVVALQAFVYWRTPFHGTLGLSLYQPVQWSVVIVLTVFGTAAALVLRRRRDA
jgi:hypothetical protein